MAERFDIFRFLPAALAAPPAARGALRLCATALLGGALWSGSLIAQGPAAPGLGTPSGRYTIECPADESAAATCAADVRTYIGWRVFQRYCASCHGADAEGSSFAPSLVARLQRFDRRAFDRALDEGYSGPLAPMRPWGEHPQVARYYDELWAYLSARVTGDLPAVPLEPLRPAQAPAE